MIFILVFCIATLGLIVGSFLNVLTLRIAVGESIVFPASHCPVCTHALAWYDLIPVLSFIMLRGACRYCQTPISWQYPLVEIVTALGFVAVFIKDFDSILLGHPLVLLRDVVMVAGFVALFVFDVRWYIVPDEVSLPLIVFAFLINLILGVPWQTLLIGMAIGGGFYAILWVASRGTWVGSGDIRIGLLIGAFLGTFGTIVALYIAYLIGGVAAAGLLVARKKGMKSILPMGTFLTIGAFLSFFVQNDLYRRFFEW